MGKWEPVDYDPFAKAAAPKGSWEEVDYDPFKAADVPLPPERPKQFVDDMQPVQPMLGGTDAPAPTYGEGEEPLSLGPQNAASGLGTPKPDARPTGAASEEITPRTHGKLFTSLFGAGTGNKTGLDQAADKVTRELEADKAYQQEIPEKDAAVLERQRRIQELEARIAETGDPRATAELNRTRLAEGFGQDSASQAERELADKRQALTTARQNPGVSQTPLSRSAERLPQAVAKQTSDAVTAAQRILLTPVRAMGVDSADKEIDREAQSRDMAINGALNPDFVAAQDLGDKIVQGLGSTAGFALTGGALSKGLGMGLGAATAVGGALPEAEQMYQEAVRRGEIEPGAESKKWWAFTMGLGVGATEALPISRAFERLEKLSGGGVTRLIGAMAASGLEEGTQEALQAVLENGAIRNALLDEKVPLSKEVVDNALVGALSGALFTGSVHGVQEMRGGHGAGAAVDAQVGQPAAPPPLSPELGGAPAPATATMPAQGAPMQGTAQPSTAVNVGNSPAPETTPENPPAPAISGGPAPEAPDRAGVPDIAAQADNDAKLLLGYGYAAEDIAAMSERQRATEVQEAREAGAQPRPMTDEERATIFPFTAAPATQETAPEPTAQEAAKPEESHPEASPQPAPEKGTSPAPEKAEVSAPSQEQTQPDSATQPDAPKVDEGQVAGQSANDGDSKKARKPRPAKDMSLSRFIAAHGGIREEGGELRARDLHSAFVPGYGRLTRGQGMTHEQAFQLARDHGYFPDFNNEAGAAGESVGYGQDSLTLDDFRNALADDYHGTRKKLDEEAAIRQMENRPVDPAEQDFYERDRHVIAIKDTLREHGGDDTNIHPAVMDEAVRLLSSGEEKDPDRAFERATLKLDMEPRMAHHVADIPDWTHGAETAGEQASGTGAGVRESGGEDGGRQGQVGSSATGERPSGARADGAQAGEGGERSPLAQAAEDRPAAVEPGADGKPQQVIPGAEQITKAEQAQRKADEGLKPKAPQKDTDGLSLFNDSSKQGDLMDALASKPKEEASDRETWPDGRWKARAGDEVYQVVGGAFGMPASIRGSVFAHGGTGELRVRVSGAGDAMGIGQYAGRKVLPYGPEWTVKDDPLPARKEQERRDAEKKKQDEFKAGLESANAAALKAAADAIAAGDEALTPENAKPGLIVRNHHPDHGGLRVVGEVATFKSGPAVFVRELDNPDEAARSAGDFAIYSIPQPARFEESTDGRDGEGSGGTSSGVQPGEGALPARDETGPLQAVAEQGATGGALQDSGDASGGNVSEPASENVEGQGSAGGDGGPSAGAGKRPGRGKRDRDARPDTGAVKAREQGEAEAREAIAQRAKLNYEITEADRIGQGSPREKIRANLRAIELAKEIVADGRQATPEEKRELVKYTGWGAFAQPMFAAGRGSELTAERQKLAALLTKEEYEAARQSTLNAHYTSESVIRGMWDAMAHLGFKGGLALEPSSGVGHFIGLTPASVREQTAWTGVELDKITGQIAQLLYAGSDFNITGFEKLNRPDNYYDLAISNVPFGDYTLNDPRYGKAGLLIHDYFFVKALDKVRPGGIVAFITSNGTMDKANDRARRMVDQRGEFIGAIRLPGGSKGAFAGNAGTDVTTDIIFIRKRMPGEESGLAQAWQNTVEIDTADGKVPVNEYFAAHPDMMLGTPRFVSSRYARPVFMLEGTTEGLQEKIAEAAKKALPAGIMGVAPKPALATVDAQDIDPTVKDGQFFEKDGKLFRRVNGVGEEQSLSKTDADKVRRLIGIRDHVTELLSEQAAGRGGKAETRAKLKKAYDAFVKLYGPINKEVRTVTSRLDKKGDPIVVVREPNVAPFRRDPDVYAVRAIESYDPETGEASPTAIFERDIISKPPEPVIASAADALALSLDRTGRVDLDIMTKALGKSEADVLAELGDALFLNPNGRQWETADEYLSGNVRQKLRDAQVAAQTNPQLKRNVEALEKVQPEPLTQGDITVQFGAPWVPEDVYTQFLRDKLGGGDRASAKRNPVTGTMVVNLPQSTSDARAQFSTSRVGIERVLDAAINRQQIVVYDKTEDDKSVVNQEATQEARVRVQAMADAFAGSIERGVDSWVWGDPDRAMRLEGIYNETFNSTVPRKFDGSHLTFPGLTKVLRLSNGKTVPFELRPHQKAAVWRTIQKGNTLYAHVVGAGKTLTMISAGMEMKRLGLVRKPMYVVPNHMLEQFSREFLQGYPAARILVANKDEMSRDERGAFVAKSATNDWDAIVITHDAFGRIPTSEAWVQKYMDEQLEELEAAIRAEKAENGKERSATVKQIEAAKKRMEARKEKLLNAARKDKGVGFEQLGVDFVFVDEAHLFKNLAFVTRLGRVKGLGGAASQRAEDLYLKVKWLDSLRPGRGAVFATGTPISNTMAEMFTMQRYLQERRLDEAGLGNFDAWAATFGQIVTNMELGADGRNFKDVTSFSRFVNIPELVSLYAEVTDTQTADMLKLPRPELKVQPSGKRGITIVESEPSDREESYIQSLIDRAAALKGKRVEKGGDNLLKVVSEGRKVATDFRLIDPRAPLNPNGKVAKAVGNIHRIWKEGKEPGLAQIVFLDMGVPNAKNQQSQTVEEGDPDDLLDADAPFNPDDIQGGFDLYSDIKNRLIEKGIPANQIAFIHDANDDIKKARLFAKVRSGEVRVLIGSTGKMGVGTNVQERLIAMHHLDAPWKPAEVEQRDGRILRQGNLNPEIEIYRYITKRSFDAFMWQKLESKAKFIAQVTSGSKGVRNAEDVDSPLPEAAEMKAAATGDPRIMQFVELEKKLQDMGAQRRAHQSTVARQQHSLLTYRGALETAQEKLPGIEADAAAAQDTMGDAFKIDLSGLGYRQPYAKRADAAQALAKWILARRNDFYRKQVIPAGTFGGLQLSLEAGLVYQNGESVPLVDAILKAPNNSVMTSTSTPITDDESGATLLRRIENLIAKVRNRPADEKAYIERTKMEVARLETAVKSAKAWPLEEEYKEVVRKHAELKKALSEKPAEKKAKPAPFEAGNQSEPPIPMDAAGWQTTRYQELPADAMRLPAEAIREIRGEIEDNIARILGDLRVELQTPRSLTSDDAEASRASGGSGATGQQIGGRHAVVRFPDRSIGSLIAVSMNPLNINPMRTAFHETWHALQQHGFISKRDKAILDREEPRLRERVREHFPSHKVEAMPMFEVEAYDAAQFMSDVLAGRQPSQNINVAVRRIYLRVLETFRRIRNYLNGLGYRTAEDVYRDAYAGKFGAQGYRGYDATEAYSTFGQDALDHIEEVRNRVGTPARPAAATTPAPYTKRPDTLLTKLDHDIADRFNGVRAWQDAIAKATGRPIPQRLDVALAADLYGGRLEAKEEDFRDQFVEPVKALLHEHRITTDELGVYLLARHAQERNDLMAQRNPKRFAPGEGGSGISNDEAAALLNDFTLAGRRDVLEQAAQLHDAIREFDLNNRVDNQLLSDEQAQEMRDEFDFYTPLRGFADVAKAAKAQGFGRIGRGFSVKGKREYKQAFGRDSLSGNPLFNMIAQAEEGIRRAEKNRVGLALLRLLRAHPNKEFAVVNKDPVTGQPLHHPTIDALVNGVVQKMPDPNFWFQDGVLGVKVGGKPVLIKILDEEVGEGLELLDLPRQNKYLEAVGNLTRAWAMLQTSRNPDFFVTNFARDQQEGLFSTASDGKKMGRRFVANMATLRAPAAAAKAMFGRPPAIYEEWRRAGGKIAFSGLRSVDDIRDEIASDLKHASESWVNPLDAARKIARSPQAALHAIVHVSEFFENTTRLAAYMAAKDVGLTEAQAARAAREATVDFNKRGAKTATITKFYAFFQANINGQAKLYRMLANSHRAKAIYGAMVPLGFAAALWNLAMSGDDDAEKWRKRYLDIPDYDRENYFIFKYGRGKTDYTKFPLPFGLKVPYRMGEQLALVMFGQIKPGTAAWNVMKAAAMSFNPLGEGGSILNWLAPTLADPIVDLVQNRKFSGSPVHPDENPSNKGLPAYRQHFSSTPGALITVAEWLNKASGGTNLTPGLLNVYPDSIGYVMDAATGGLGRSVAGAGGMAKSLLTGDAIDWTKVPAVRRFMPTSEERMENQRYYETKNMAQADANRIRAGGKGDAADKAEGRTIEGELGVTRKTVKPKAGGTKEQFVWKDTPVDTFRRADADLKALREQRDKVSRDQTLSPLSRTTQLREIEKKMATTQHDARVKAMRKMKADDEPSPLLRSWLN